MTTTIAYMTAHPTYDVYQLMIEVVMQRREGKEPIYYVHCADSRPTDPVRGSGAAHEELTHALDEARALLLGRLCGLDD